MLILMRRAGESIIIGDDISVSILNIRGEQVRIGIDAPRNVTVHREEVYRRIHQGKDEQAEEKLDEPEFLDRKRII